MRTAEESTSPENNVLKLMFDLFNMTQLRHGNIGSPSGATKFVGNWFNSSAIESRYDKRVYENIRWCLSNLADAFLWVRLSIFMSHVNEFVMSITCALVVVTEYTYRISLAKFGGTTICLYATPA